MNTQEIKTKIEKAFPGSRLKLVRESILVENAGDLPKIAQFLKDSPDLRMDYLSSVTGADYLDYLEAVYHFYSMEKKTGPVVLRVRVKRENPKVPSLVTLYRGAELQEREAYDLFGIVFEGHPDLRRLFMWDRFEGFPLRKDFIPEDSEILEADDLEWLEAYQVTVPEEARKRAESLKREAKRALADREGKEKG